MNHSAAIVILLLLLAGPLTIRPIEHNLELFILAIGVLATLCGQGFNAELIRHVLSEPIPITIAVVVAAVIFREVRGWLDRMFALLRTRIRRPFLAALSIFAIAMVSSIITAIVAALVLVEIVGLLQLHDGARERVVVAGCFAIGLGAVLTPLGEPLSTLAADALELGFLGLFDLLALWVIPGIAAMALLAGYFAAGEYFEAPPGLHIRETWFGIMRQAVEVFGFIAGLILIGEAYAPLARQIIPRLSDVSLFWANMLSAVLDNATLVALEIRAVEPRRALEIILALLISGGMLIPGNIPNVIAAGALSIKSGRWASIAIPIGVAMLGIYFALLWLSGLIG